MSDEIDFEDGWKVLFDDDSAELTKIHVRIVDGQGDERYAGTVQMAMAHFAMALSRNDELGAEAKEH